MTERHNGRHLPNTPNHIERGAQLHGRIGVIVFQPKDQRQIGRFHEILGPVSQQPGVEIVDALAPGRFHRRNPNAFLHLPDGLDFGGLLSEMAGTVDHAYVLVEKGELKNIVGHLEHDLSNGSGCMQDSVTVLVPGGDIADISEINQGVGKSSGFRVRRI